jgi:hypothetical protein
MTSNLDDPRRSTGDRARIEAISEPDTDGTPKSPHAGT